MEVDLGLLRPFGGGGGRASSGGSASGSISMLSKEDSGLEYSVGSGFLVYTITNPLSIQYPTQEHIYHLLADRTACGYARKPFDRVGSSGLKGLIGFLLSPNLNQLN